MTKTRVITDSKAMPSALPRRALLAGIAALPVAAWPDVMGAAASSADTSLLALGRELREAWLTETSAYAHSDTIPASEAEAYIKPYHDASSAIVEQIIATRAMSADGVMMKVLAWTWCQGNPSDVFEPLGEDDVTDERAINSAERDVLLLMGWGA